jgi:hypothetical protein
MLARLTRLFNINVEKTLGDAAPIDTAMLVAVAAGHASQPGTRSVHHGTTKRMHWSSAA